LISALNRVFSRLVASLRRSTPREDEPSSRPREDLDQAEVAMTAHDCLSLLDIMVTCANGMRGSHPSKRASDDDTVEFHKAAERLRHLAQLLVASRPVHPSESRPVDVNQLIAESQGMLTRVLPAGTSLRLELAEMQATVKADRWEIERILLNLVLNASRGLPSESVVTIRTASMKQVPPGLRSPHIRARSYLTLTVSDARATAHRRTRVIAHFWNPERLGSDLSLATVARSVQQLEGALQFEIDSERHMRIRVDLPLALDSPHNEPPVA
jgi:two-component system cell cycle sensor histidine kinase/response regulator CckA